jgi:hypothetical protein
MPALRTATDIPRTAHELDACIRERQKQAEHF